MAQTAKTGADAAAENAKHATENVAEIGKRAAGAAQETAERAACPGNTLLFQCREEQQFLFSVMAFIRENTEKLNKAPKCRDVNIASVGNPVGKRPHSINDFLDHTVFRAEFVDWMTLQHVVPW